MVARCPLPRYIRRIDEEYLSKIPALNNNENVKENSTYLTFNLLITLDVIT